MNGLEGGVSAFLLHSIRDDDGGGGGDEGKGGDEGGPEGTMIKIPRQSYILAHSLLVWRSGCIQKNFESFVQIFSSRWTWCP